MKNLPAKALRFLLALALIVLIVSLLADVIRSHTAPASPRPSSTAPVPSAAAPLAPRTPEPGETITAMRSPAPAP